MSCRLGPRGRRRSDLNGQQNRTVSPARFRSSRLPSPCEEQALRNAVSPRHLAHHGPRHQRLFNDPRLLVLAPTPSALDPETLPIHLCMTLRLAQRSHPSRRTPSQQGGRRRTDTQEPDFTQGPYAQPPSSLLDQIWKWISVAFRESGADTEMGLKLRKLYLGAGLSDLHLEADRFIGGGTNWGGYDHLAGLATSVLPFLEARGIATTKEVQPETLAERLRDDIVSHEGVVMWLTVVRLWGQKK